MREILKNGEKKRKKSLDSDINNGKLEDRLSLLPDTLLVRILSLLPCHWAVATSVLSRRWRFLWTQLSRLHFDSKQFEDLPFSQVSSIVNLILRQLNFQNFYGFYLDYPYAETEEEIDTWSSNIASWIPQICQRNPQDIKVTLQVPTTRYALLSLPICLFDTFSLVNLELSGPFSCDFPASTIKCLPNLKKLEMKFFYMGPDLMGKFIKSCPSLESLSLELIWVEEDLVMEISAPNLKSLAVTMSGYAEDCKFSIDAPILEHVLLHGNFSFYHFANKLSRLLSADLGFCPSTFQGRNDYLTHISVLLEEISGAKIIHLVDNIAMFNSSNYVDARVLETFPNLTRLRLTRVSIEQVN